MALDVVSCLCGQNNVNTNFMIQCDSCKVWFHGRCVCVREYQAVDIDQYHCPRCEFIHGPSVLKPRLNWHRHNYSEAEAAGLPVQTGTQVFIKELKSRHFPGCDDVVLRLRGSALTLPYFLTNGFSKPILVEDKNGLDVIVPHNTFTVMDVQTYVGAEHEVDVIDVQRQTNVKMQLQEFVEYYLSPARTTVLNLISLEFSHTNLSQLVEPPYIVRKMCWVTSSWPTDPPPPLPLVRPNVNKYCLISVENSYTDFHIDFGGTSVWYHVLWGEKIFYLIQPTPANLALYQRWMKANNQSEMFFGDQVDCCCKCVVKAGETLFIPTGWIHAVLTPIDTLVFGGNFLSSYNIDLQLQIYEMEKHMNTPSKFRFPSYESVCWYSAVNLVNELRDMSSSGNRVPPLFLTGIRALMVALRHWTSEIGGLERPPPGINPAKLLKDLQKEVRMAERQVVALNPPKPERESKRKKRKVVSEDFIDYTELTSFDTALEERIPVKHIKDDNFEYPDESDRFDSQHFRIIDNQDSEGQTQPLQLTMPKPASYPYGIGIGMTGTPPHDPNFPTFKTEYPSNVKTEFDWSESSGVSYKMIDPAALRIRMARASLDELPVPGTPPSSGTPPTPGSLRIKIGRRSVDSKSTDSVYEFNDEIEELEETDPSALMIDEAPKNKARLTQIQQAQGLKLKLNLGTRDHIYGEPIDMTGSVEVLSSHTLHSTNNFSHNGIEELLRASAYAPEFAAGSPAQMEDLETGRASPSTREAIVGMLSMSRVVPGNRNPHKSTRRIATTPFKLQRSKRRYTEDENISKVHQDDDYVYPSLDLSDDEDFPVFKPRGKKKEDEAWNPKARIRVSETRPERPLRIGVRRQAVEKGLEQAAARRQSVPLPKRAYQRKKRSMEHQAGTSGCSPTRSSDFNKPKKGMATAKQRLGKILKIHKMLH